jgi:HlyD family secretion protein
MKNKLKFIPVIAVIIIVSFKLFDYFQHHNKFLNQRIYVSGNIEATEVIVSFQVSGKIKEIFTDEGKIVKKDDVLAMLDTEELLRVQAQTQAALREAELNYKKLKDDAERAERLFEGGAISGQDRDDAKTGADMAEARKDNLENALALANIRLKYAQLLAPLDGFVLVKSREVGELVQIGDAIFILADLHNIWLTGYINETELGKVKLNQDAEITIDTYPGKIYKGRVSFISQEAEFTPKHIQTKEERAKLVYRIKIAIDNTDLELKSGMPADAYIIAK